MVCGKSLHKRDTKNKRDKERESKRREWSGSCDKALRLENRFLQEWPG